MNFINSIKEGKKLIAIYALTIATKISGLSWGFPATLHNDESNVIRSSLGIRFGDLNPHHFDWPSLYFYINYFFFWTFIKLRTRLQIWFGVEQMQKSFSFWWGPELPFYLIGRIITNVFVVLTAIVTYKLALEINKNKKVAIMSTVFFLIGSWVTYLSFYALSDMALIFFMMASVLFSQKIVRSGKTKDYVLAAIFAGLATSTKYTGFLACLIIPIAHVLYTRSIISVFNKKIVMAVIVSIGVFFIGTPYALLDWKTFSGTKDATGALWQINHIGFGTNWSYHLLRVIPENFGIPLTILGFTGFVLFLKKSSYYKLSILTFTLILAYIGTWRITRAHYTAPLFPIFAIFAAYSTYHLILKYKLNRYQKMIFVSLLILLPTLGSASDIIKRNRQDTRLLAGRWIDKNIPKGSYIIAKNERTGIFGGDLPLFSYDNYYISTPNLPSDNISNAEEYLILTNTKISGKKYHLIYYQDNFLRTGPTISVLKSTTNGSNLTR